SRAPPAHAHAALARRCGAALAPPRAGLVRLRRRPPSRSSRRSARLPSAQTPRAPGTVGRWRRSRCFSPRSSSRAPRPPTGKTHRYRFQPAPLTRGTSGTVGDRRVERACTTLSMLFPLSRRMLGDGLDPEARGQARGAALSLLVQVAGVVVSYAIQIVLARVLGPREFGTYSYVVAWCGPLSMAAGLGLPTVALRFLPVYRAAGDRERLTGLVLASERIALAASLGVA